MGLYVSTEAVKDRESSTSFFGYNRLFGAWPTLYGSMKTAVTVDVLEAGFILAFLILAFSFYIILPGIRGWERLYAFIRITVSLFVGLVVILTNWGQEWEVGEIITLTQYRANTDVVIKAHVGVKMGLRNINVTLKGINDEDGGDYNDELGERINYNDRFWWSFPFDQGRIGFGPYASEISQEFRAAQRKGLPYPILWVVEYFTFDGEGIRWGRHYRTAGWYAHIAMWTAFPLWILANILFFMVVRYGGYMMTLMGTCMVLANIMWGTIRNPNELVIPFESAKLVTHFGWCFWLNLITGILSIISGLLIVVLDIFIPEKLSAFFGVDILKDYEEFYAEETVKSTGDSKAPAGNRKSVSVPKFRKRGLTVKSLHPQPVLRKQRYSPEEIEAGPGPETVEQNGQRNSEEIGMAEGPHYGTFKQDLPQDSVVPVGQTRYTKPRDGEGTEAVNLSFSAE